MASATISYTRAGFINDAGAFTDGDVSTLAEYNAVVGDCAAGTQNPIIYDADAAILIALGKDEESVIGFAGSCALDTGAGEIVSSHVVMNGLFQDGANNPVPDLSTAEFDATFIHEFGHFSGLDHSQINVGCASGFCSSDDLAGLPTMFPFLISGTQRHAFDRRHRLDFEALPGGGRQRLRGDPRHDQRHRIFLRRRITRPVRQRRGAARRQSRDGWRQREPNDGWSRSVGIQVSLLQRQPDQ